VWVRVRSAACTYLGSSCPDTWYGRGHPWTTEGRPPLTDQARLSAAPINDYFIPRIDKVSRDRPSWKMHTVYPNWSRLLWLPRFEFQEITTGCFEKSVRGVGNGRFVSMEDLKKDTQVAYGY